MNDQLNQLETSVEQLVEAFKKLQAENEAMARELESLRSRSVTLVANQDDIKLRIEAIRANIQSVTGSL